VAGEEGKVFVRSEPVGAEVLRVDEAKVELGRTPVLVVLPVGEVSLLLRLQGFHDKLIELEVKGTEIVKLDVVKLDVVKVKVDVVFLEEGWAIVVDKVPYVKDGKAVVAPATIEVTPGSHEVRLVKSGFQDIVKQIKDENTITVVDKPKINNKPQQKIDQKQQINLDKITLEQWNMLHGQELTVPSTREYDTDIVVNSAILLIPNPVDKWTTNRGVNPDVGFKGDPDHKHGKYPSMALCYRFDDDTVYQPINNDGIIHGNGKLYLICNDANRLNNQGTIKVKIMRYSIVDK
jgi:hypothetical protein